MENNKRRRITLEISEGARRDLEDMTTTLLIKNNADLVRYSLGLLSFLVKMKKEGCEIMLRKSDGETSRLLMPFLGFN